MVENNVFSVYKPRRGDIIVIYADIHYVYKYKIQPSTKEDLGDNSFLPKLHFPRVTFYL